MPPKARSWKGFERKVAKCLQTRWPEAKRGRQFLQGKSVDRTEPDITGTGNVWVECSRIKDAGIDAVNGLARKKYRQACRDRAFVGALDHRILVAISAGKTGSLGMYGLEVEHDSDVIEIAKRLGSGGIVCRVLAPVVGEVEKFGVATEPVVWRWLVLARAGPDSDTLIDWAFHHQVIESGSVPKP